MLTALVRRIIQSDSHGYHSDWGRSSISMVYTKILELRVIHSVPKKMSYFAWPKPYKVGHFFGTLCICMTIVVVYYLERTAAVLVSA